MTEPRAVRSGHSKYILKAELWVVNKGLIPKTVAQANEKRKSHFIKEGGLMKKRWRRRSGVCL